MAVHAQLFGGVRLSGKSAKKFVDQVTYGKPKKAAVEAVKVGREMMKEYAAKGYVVVKTKAKK